MGLGFLVFALRPGLGAGFLVGECLSGILVAALQIESQISCLWASSHAEAAFKKCLYECGLPSAVRVH